MWWCIVVHAQFAHACAPHQIYTRIDCTNNVLSNLPYFAVWVAATTQTSLKKIALCLGVLHGKNGPKTPITTLTFLKNPSLWVVVGQLSRDSVYELWCHNNQAHLTLPTN